MRSFHVLLAERLRQLGGHRDRVRPARPAPTRRGEGRERRGRARRGRAGSRRRSRRARPGRGRAWSTRAAFVFTPPMSHPRTGVRRRLVIGLRSRVTWAPWTSFRCWISRAASPCGRRPATARATSRSSRRWCPSAVGDAVALLRAFRAPARRHVLLRRRPRRHPGRRGPAHAAPGAGAARDRVRRRHHGGRRRAHAGEHASRCSPAARARS